MNETTIRPPAAITSAKVAADLGLVLITGIHYPIVAVVMNPWGLGCEHARSTCGEFDVMEVESIGCLDRRRNSSVVTMVRTVARMVSIAVPAALADAGLM
ncbi:hypothetical protein Tco_1241121 [Tanacetum coccineum]